MSSVSQVNNVHGEQGDVAGAKNIIRYTIRFKVLDFSLTGATNYRAFDATLIVL